MGGLFGGGSKSTKTQPSTIITENPTPRGSGYAGDDKNAIKALAQANAAQQQQAKKADTTLLGREPTSAAAAIAKKATSYG